MVFLFQVFGVKDSKLWILVSTYKAERKFGNSDVIKFNK